MREFREQTPVGCFIAALDVPMEHASRGTVDLEQPHHDDFPKLNNPIKIFEKMSRGLQMLGVLLQSSSAAGFGSTDLPVQLCKPQAMDLQARL